MESQQKKFFRPDQINFFKVFLEEVLSGCSEVLSKMDASMAQKTWEMANNVETVNSVDEIYRFDKKQHDDILTAKPWDKE